VCRESKNGKNSMNLRNKNKRHHQSRESQPIVH